LVAEFLTGGGDPEPALEALGAARAAAGVGLDEALADLGCLAAVLPEPLDPWLATQSLARGWADGATARMAPAPLMDPSADLATLAYLSVRLREVYAGARRTGVPVTLTHGLVVVDTALMCPDPWSRLQRGMELGAVFREVFDGGETLVSLGQNSGAALALVPRTAQLGASLRTLRDTLACRFAPFQARHAARDPIRLWVEALPSDYDAALALLAELAR
jgi:hypothetical protein